MWSNILLFFSGREKGGVIRGGKGTLKRKQDIRDFLNEQNEDYEDDLFEGTPFVKIKQNPLVGQSVIKGIGYCKVKKIRVLKISYVFFSSILS